MSFSCRSLTSPRYDPKCSEKLATNYQPIIFGGYMKRVRHKGAEVPPQILCYTKSCACQEFVVAMWCTGSSLNSDACKHDFLGSSVRKTFQPCVHGKSKFTTRRKELSLESLTMMAFATGIIRAKLSSKWLESELA